MKKLIQLLGFILLLPACSRPAASRPAPNGKQDQALINVVTSLAEDRPIPRYLPVTGELRAAKQAMLAPDTSGKVVAAPIERGSMVREGDVILKLDDRAATNALQESEASLADARLKLNWARSESARSEPMAKSHGISAAEFERLTLNQATAETALAAATARRDQSKKALDDTVLRAPFAGTVAERLTDVGAFVSSTMGVAQLVATEQLRLMLNVPETAVGSVSEGQRVSFVVPAFPRAKFTGTVKFIGAALRESARDLIVEAEVHNGDGKLKPGMFAEGRLVLGEETAVTVPLSALQTVGSTHKLFVVRDGQVEERIVEVGETEGDVVEICRGVMKGDAVILAPGASAVDGVKVVSKP
ncbi:MAG: efflux transporter periplasmic adaptor subunit [Chthoniobacteraceae bacterium]|nr:efflux transporter periplasmic adaptor subunit [Chthoniobacteraceae bacterium]